MPILGGSSTSTGAPGRGTGTLVGDVILMCREQIPDMPPVLGTPTATVAQTAATPTLAAGSYLVKATQLTQWGESLPSTEQGPVTVDATHGIQVTSVLLPGAVKIRAYFGIGAGAENQWQESTTSPFTISTPGIGGVVPLRSTAYLPDMDGQAFAASTLFRWLSVGLRECSRFAGGFPNYSGVSTVQGSGQYVLRGEWVKVTDLWYDGWPMGLDRRGNFFQRNAVTSSVLSGGALSVQDNRVVLEVWPQAARTPGLTTLTNPISISDPGTGLSSVSVNSTAGFLLPFGFFSVFNATTPTDTEIFYYSGFTANAFTNCIRAFGATAPGGLLGQAWPTGSQVSELNLMIHGMAVANNIYTPGMATFTLPVPGGWDTMLTDYMLAKAANAQGDGREAQRLAQQVDGAILKWARMNRQLAGPQQISDGRGTQFLVYGQHGFGGTILP